MYKNTLGAELHTDAIVTKNEKNSFNVRSWVFHVFQTRSFYFKIIIIYYGPVPAYASSFLCRMRLFSFDDIII